MVWDATRIAPKPWASILELYRYLEERNDDFRPLGRLVDHVASQGYAGSIAGATSGTALLVAPLSPIDWAHDAMRVDVDLGGSIRFTYPRKGLAKPSTFDCDGAKIIGAFESFLRNAGWIGA